MWHKLALLACLALSGSAQDAVSNATSGPWTAELNGVWRWHQGDDMRWAAPFFDDSGWPIQRGQAPPPSTLYWLRSKLHVGRLINPTLLVGPVASAYEVYWDGKPIGEFGHPCTHAFVPRWQVFPIPVSETAPGQHTLALRSCFFGSAGGRVPRISSIDNRVGESTAIADVQTALVARDFRSQLLKLLVNFTIFLAGMYFLLLPPSVSQGAAFRWFGAFLMFRALVVFDEFYVNYGPLVLTVTETSRTVIPLIYFGIVSWLQFAYSLFRRGVPKPVRGLEILVLVAAANGLLSVLPNFGSFAAWVFGPANIASAIVPLVVAAEELRKRTPGARAALAIFSVNAIASLAIVGRVHYRLPIPGAFHIGGFSLRPVDAAIVLLVPAMAMQIHKINQRFRDEQQRLRGEMEAARHVQELMLPPRALEIAGFKIDVSYQPAMEVGGDFFQFFAAAGDSLLLVIGDVSGKGMKAALLVSVIVGALQNRNSDEPATVLRELNAVLLGRSEGGFTTCCCALFAPEGALTMANAGHLAPYRNGGEIETPPGFPLGIDPDAHWPETHTELDPNDRILWISDGVLEARNGNREILGFKRAEELTARSASEIARAAQQFGQDDDITVVSITRQAVAAYVA